MMQRLDDFFDLAYGIGNRTKADINTGHSGEASHTRATCKTLHLN